jgi:hypothetical protein
MPRDILDWMAEPMEIRRLIKLQPGEAPPPVLLFSTPIPDGYRLETDAEFRERLKNKPPA